MKDYTIYSTGCQQKDNPLDIGAEFLFKEMMDKVGAQLEDLKTLKEPNPTQTKKKINTKL